MKKLLILPLLLFVLYSSAQGSKSNNSDYPTPFEFAIIDSTITGTKAELFVKANEWVAKTFNSAKDVIQMSDKDAGKIIAKGVMDAICKFGLGRSKFYIKYTLSIDLKDNKCRIKMLDFIVEKYQVVSTLSNNDISDLNAPLNTDEPPSLGMFASFPQKTWESIKAICTYQSNELIKDALASFRAKSDNW